MSTGDIITSLSVLVAAGALFYAMYQANTLRRQQYADNIRAAASQTTAALDRWKELCLRLYADLQPLLTDTDMEFVENRDVVAARDHLWRGLTQLRSAATERITNEKIETSYVGLYGYDARIQRFFADVTSTVKTLDNEAYLALLRDTQACVLGSAAEARYARSAELGNRLRTVAASHSATLSHLLGAAIEPCSFWLLKIIEAKDADIVGHRAGLQDIGPLGLTAGAGERFVSPLPAPYDAADPEDDPEPVRRDAHATREAMTRRTREPGPVMRGGMPGRD
jgi:hypothetical protein